MTFIFDLNLLIVFIEFTFSLIFFTIIFQMKRLFNSHEKWVFIHSFFLIQIKAILFHNQILFLAHDFSLSYSDIRVAWFFKCYFLITECCFLCCVCSGCRWLWLTIDSISILSVNCNAFLEKIGKWFLVDFSMVLNFFS